MGTLKIGVALWSLGPTRTLEDLREKLQTAVELGLRGVQLWAVDYGPNHPCALDPDRCGPKERAEVRRLLEEMGLALSGLCAQLAGPTRFGGLDEEEGLEERVLKTKKALELAADLGTPVVTTHPGAIPEDRQHPTYQLMLRTIGEIAAHGERVGSFFCIETGQEHPRVLRRFIEDVGSPALKVNYDPANVLRYQAVVEGVELLAPWIVHTHAKDHNPETGRPTVGQGAVPWPEYIAALQRIGYDGWFALEDESGRDVLESLKAGKAFLEQF